MNIGFYLTQGDPSGYVLADLLLRSIQRTMPGVPVSQFTDLKSPSVYGVTHVLRQPPQSLSLLRSLHYASVEGDWVFLDTDILVQRDVRNVFLRPFDIALADRRWPHIPPTPDFTSAMPWNAGVIFSRCPDFWWEIHERLKSDTSTAGNFFGDQAVICDLAKSDRYRILELPGMVYNYPPASADDAGKDAAIVHFKGPRKRWMLDRLQPCA